MAASIMKRPRINVDSLIEEEGVIGIGEFGVYGARPNGEYVSAALPVLAVVTWYVQPQKQTCIRQKGFIRWDAHRDCTVVKQRLI